MAPTSSASVASDQGWSGAGLERAVGLAEEEFAGLAGGAGDENVVNPVAIDVGDGEHRTQAVEPAREQPLAGEFVERPKRVGVLQALR